MPRRAFTLRDLALECQIEEGCHRVDDGRPRRLGLRVHVPDALHGTYPYAASAYAFLQELRREIFEHGVIEFPGLPVNRTNHTLAQRAPREHAYSKNPYLTDECQSPHQDTPPYPTAFWLGAERRYFATWLLSATAAEAFYRYREQHPALSIEEVHRRLVPASLAEGTGTLVNHTPGLVLIDNSSATSLYHARTCRFDAVAKSPAYARDTPAYAFNEIGLLHHIDALDERRGDADRSREDLAEMRAFLAREVAAHRERFTRP